MNSENEEVFVSNQQKFNNNRMLANFNTDGYSKNPLTGSTAAGEEQRSSPYDPGLV